MSKDHADKRTLELPFVRNAWNYDRDELSNKTGLTCKDPTRTQQHLSEEADINTIVKRFKLTGQLPTNIRMPTSGDFTNVPTFDQAMHALVQAREAFQALPAKIRARFHNDPAELVAFCDDPENLQEARKLGLVPKDELPPKVEQAGEAPPTPTAQPAPAAQTPAPTGAGVT